MARGGPVKRTHTVSVRLTPEERAAWDELRAAAGRRELERAGLLPDAELQQLRRRVEQLTGELASSRQLVVSTERAAAAEREARERLEAALFERQAAAAAAIAVADELRGPGGRSAGRWADPGMEARLNPSQGRRSGLSARG